MISSKKLEILEKSPWSGLIGGKVCSNESTTGRAFWEPLDFKTTVCWHLIRQRIKVRVYLSPHSATSDRRIKRELGVTGG